MFPNDFESEFTFENAAVPLPEEPPFHIIMLGDWCGTSGRKELTERQAIEIDRDNFDDVLKDLKVGIDLALEGDPDTTIHLQFEELDDFHPDNIFRKVSLFSDLRDVRRRLSDPETYNLAAQEVRSWFNTSENSSVDDAAIQSQIEDTPPLESNNLLDLILDHPNVSTVPGNTQTVDNSALGKFVSKLVSPYLIKIDEDEQWKLIALVDNTISELMRAVLHHPQFQALESAWRGLFLLVRRVETDRDLKIFIFDIIHQELIDNLKSVNSLTDSFVHRVLTSEAFAIVGGNYSFGINVDDIATLMRLATLAFDFDSAFVSYIKPEIFGINDFLKFNDASSLDSHKDSREAKLWSALRQIPEASHIGLSPMRILGRMPYGKMSDSIESFAFEEFDENIDFEKFLWLNPCFVITLLLAQSYKISGSENKKILSYNIDNLPIYNYRDKGEARTLPCAEVILTETSLEKILDQGLIPLISFRDSNRVKIGSYRSISFNRSRLNGRSGYWL